MIYKLKCDFCGKEIERYSCKKHNFCSRECLAKFSSKKTNPERYTELKDYRNIGTHMTELNKKLNPTRMTKDKREKLRNSMLGKGEGKSYSKYYGVHEHRVVAEAMLDRPLLPKEVVHHIDGNKRNNDKNNLIVLPSQSEHAKLHQRLNKFWGGGDA